MNLPELNTRTRATVELLPQFGLDGAPCLVVVIKQQFVVHHMRVLERQNGAQVRLVDELWEPDAPESTIRYPADGCLGKPSTDVVVVGNAMAPHSKSVTELDVHVQVGPVRKQLKVFGLRVWFRGALGMALTAPRPFQSVPLRWEYAYGGMDTSNPKKLAREPRNPVGRGVVADTDTLLHKPGPQIEDPSELISSARTRPAPTGVGALGPQFEPRARYAGTYDDRWQKERMPLPPLDFDKRFFQVAAPGLVSPSYLRGGESVVLVGLCEGGPLEFELPKLAFFVGSRTVKGDQEYRPVLDTVLFEPNERRIEMTWRSCIPVPRRAHDLKAVTVYEKEFR
ncbi:DUF2169 family type VI secretion system accessory protein [Hyalangium versicolor]|uniref:DUF2169 family type VI secretion system accessory protein n=1 Tax=Hyalangium versicolor TaxID=2861190 RepID=UPI001CCC4089|nr:DUF2169 domain-containing protein [Hyalangium versicolor]